MSFVIASTTRTAPAVVPAVLARVCLKRSTAALHTASKALKPSVTPASTNPASMRAMPRQSTPVSHMLNQSQQRIGGAASRPNGTQAGTSKPSVRPSSSSSSSTPSSASTAQSTGTGSQANKYSVWPW